MYTLGMKCKNTAQPCQALSGLRLGGITPEGLCSWIPINTQGVYTKNHPDP